MSARNDQKAVMVKTTQKMSMIICAFTGFLPPDFLFQLFKAFSVTALYPVDAVFNSQECKGDEKPTNAKNRS
jgi:hypothetical protein